MNRESRSEQFSLRVVLDTSVLLSGHRHWLWLLADLGYFKPVWSAFIVGEMVRVRVEHSARRGVERSTYRQRINDLIHLLSDVTLVVNYREISVSGTLRDSDDEPILATALVARAPYIVSLNTRDFPPSNELAGVRFLTPDDFLAKLASRYPEKRLEERASNAGRQLP